ncbi:Hypothetical_protein [Hexamita inflata]|uniref:Hypothetical_protein n=1 Tax=Hexamita inflata TaxID=28002 RepID=A0AA86Q4U0_9EUKA|nr:Hypothetical protein HINF_LOCUS33399 [Hexamita inflata]
MFVIVQRMQIYYITLLVRDVLFRVGQLTYKGVPSFKTPLQASGKQHSFQPRFLIAVILQVLHNLACKGGAFSLIRVQVNSLIREFHHAKLPYKRVANTKRFNPVFAHKSFKSDIFPRYILNTFLLIREMKSVTPLQASKLLPYKQGYVVNQILLIVFKIINRII